MEQQKCFNVPCARCGKPIMLQNFDEHMHGVFASFASSLAANVICDECAEKAKAEEQAKRDAEWKEKLPRLYLEAGIPTAFTLMAEAKRQDVAKLIWQHRFENLFITGDTGTGKSTSACRVLMRMIENGWHVKYMKFSTFIDKIRDCKMRRPDEYSDITQVEVFYDKLKQYKVLCIDEIAGKTKTGENVMEILFDLIDAAYSGTICPVWLIGNVRQNSMDMLFGEETESVMRRLQSFRFRQIGLTMEGISQN